MGRNVASLATAAILSVTVLGIFYSHQWHGPVGVLQRYLVAAMREDIETMRKLEYPPTTMPNSRFLQGYRHVQRFNIVAQRQLNEDLVWIKTEIAHPGLPVIPVISWVMVKRPDGWKVDILRTLQVN